MSGRQKTSLYWLVLILFLFSGCVKKDLPSVKPVALPTSTPTVFVVAQTELESATLEPTSPLSTATASIGDISGECKKIAFSMYEGLNYDLYTICADGSQLVRLTNDPADDVNPAWSPDGSKIAFASARSGHFQIYQMSEDGTEVIALTSDYENLNPVWLPDGMHIAFRTDDGKGLYWWRVLNLENYELTTITEASYDFFYQTPAWSPDGKNIAYMSLVEQQERNDGSSQIHVKNVEGTNDIALTNDVWANFNPKWSPDGSKIAFLSERGGTYNMFTLYIMNSDGTDVQQLTETNYQADIVYSWSPDGKQIAVGGTYLVPGITILDINSQSSIPLIAWTTPAIWPSWQP